MSCHPTAVLLPTHKSTHKCASLVSAAESSSQHDSLPQWADLPSRLHSLSPSNLPIDSPAFNPIQDHTDTILIDSDSSDSSYSLIVPFHSHFHHNMPSQNIAECIHDELKRIPLLTAGEISPLVMHQWEMACKDFFSASKKVEVADHVATILPGLKDLCAHNWVATHHADLVALSFDDFIVDL